MLKVKTEAFRSVLGICGFPKGITFRFAKNLIRTHLCSRTEMAVVDKGGGVVEMVPGDEDEEVGIGN